MIENEIGEYYYLERELFSKDMNRLWMRFKGSAKSVRDTYLFIRLIHQELLGNDFDSEFKCNWHKVSYRSLLKESQTKIHLKNLRKIGLIDYRKEKTGGSYKNGSTSYYRVKKVNRFLINEAIDNKIIDSF